MTQSPESEREKQAREKWENMPKRDWDGTTPVCTHDDDRYFFDLDDLYCYAEDHGIAPEDVMLVHCVPDNGPIIDTSIFDDHLPEDSCDLHDEVVEAIENLNDAIAKHAPYSWWPDKVAVNPDSVRSLFAE